MVLLGESVIKPTLISIPMVGGEAVVPVMSVTPHVVFNYGCLGWVMQRPVPPFLSRVARTVQLETPGGLHNDIATIGKRRIRIRAPLDNSCNDPVSMAHSSRFPAGKDIGTCVALEHL